MILLKIIDGNKIGDHESLEGYTLLCGVHKNCRKTKNRSTNEKFFDIVGLSGRTQMTRVI